MFLGTHLQRMDDKGRISIPAAFRKVIVEGGQTLVYLTQSRDTCLVVHTGAAWEKLLSEWQERPTLDPEREDFERVYLACTWPMEVDRLGRILIPAEARQYAQLEREAFFAGRGQLFEIWHPELWAAARAASAARLGRGR